MMSLEKWYILTPLQKLPKNGGDLGKLIVFLKNGPFPASFLYFRLFYKQLTVNKCSIKVADDWIRTLVLWYRKRPLCQLRHNHCIVFYSTKHASTNVLNSHNLLIKQATALK